MVNNTLCIYIICTYEATHANGRKIPGICRNGGAGGREANQVGRQELG